MQDAMDQICDIVFDVRPFHFIPTVFKMKTNFIIFYAVTNLFHMKLLPSYHEAMREDNLNAGCAAAVGAPSIADPAKLDEAAAHLTRLHRMNSVADGIAMVQAFFEGVVAALPDANAAADDILPAVIDGMSRCGALARHIVSSFTYLAEVWPQEGLSERITYILVTCSIAASHFLLIFFSLKNVNYFDAILDSKSPSIDSLLHSSDVQSIYRMGNQKLVKFLTKSSSIEQIINTLHSSQEFPVVRRIFGLLSSPNTSLLKEIFDSKSHFEHLLSILDKTETVHRYVIGIIASVLLKAFDLSNKDFFSKIRQSTICYIKLINCLHVPSIFHFLNHVVSCKESEIFGQSLIWLIFLSLMGGHGPGAKAPAACANDACMKSKISKLGHVQRMRCLDLLCSFFNEFVEDETDLFKAINNGLPLLLQDSFDDEERSLVFKLGLILNPNEALAIAAVSILNCFKSSELLLQFSLLYITAFDVKIGPRSIELFIYRLLSKSRNNFVLIAASKMLMASISQENDKRGSIFKTY